VWSATNPPGGAVICRAGIGLIGFITGAVAYQTISLSKGRLRGQWLALAGLVLSFATFVPVFVAWLSEFQARDR
jgi:hypothetical protein